MGAPRRSIPMRLHFPSMKKFLQASLLLSTTLLGFLTQLQAGPGTTPLMPVPLHQACLPGRLVLSENLHYSISGYTDAVLESAVARTVQAWATHTGKSFVASRAQPPQDAILDIACKETGMPIPQLGDDESYTLKIDGRRVELSARTSLGVLRGLATLTQLIQEESGTWILPCIEIRDEPRFPWRGLMIDVCRHWQPIDVIKRNLDGMALVKLNVLHFHLTDDQGFRVESKTYPKLHELGSDGLYYTQEQIRDVVAYAAARGIRVVPEFDVPGHATSWVVGYPELASAPGPYSIERRWGVFDPVLDPTNEATYAMLDSFLGEMAGLFPDAYMHIGGDENNGKQWNGNPRIQAFIKENKLGNNEGLHTYFNGRLQAILAKHGKKMIGWDEILHPGLPANTLVHSWRGKNGLAEASRMGFSAILSNGFYLDHMLTASKYYANDPIPADSPLSLEQQKRILGGEACMWCEWVSSETIDSRIWPRAAAVAERLWSPRETRDSQEMYRRLAIVSHQLDELGLLHEKNVAVMRKRFAGETAGALEQERLNQFFSLIEAGSLSMRRACAPHQTQATPLVGFADCALADSYSARDFAARVQSFVASSKSVDVAEKNALILELKRWQELALSLGKSTSFPAASQAEIVPVAQAIQDACLVGVEALGRLGGKEPVADSWNLKQQTVLGNAAKPSSGVVLPFIPALRLLVANTSADPLRGKLTPKQWADRLAELVKEQPEKKL